MAKSTPNAEQVTGQEQREQIYATNPWLVVKIPFADTPESLDDIAGNCNQLHRNGYSVHHSIQVNIEDKTYILIYAKRTEKA